MGTAGAVKLLQDRLHGTFVVGSGDSSPMLTWAISSISTGRGTPSSQCP